jgi:hypothetical protein
LQHGCTEQHDDYCAQSAYSKHSHFSKMDQGTA